MNKKEIYLTWGIASLAILLVIGAVAPNVYRGVFQGTHTGDGSALSNVVSLSSVSNNDTRALTLTNPANVFAGDGSGLENVGNPAALSNYDVRALVLTNPANVLAGNGATLTNLPGALNGRELGMKSDGTDAGPALNSAILAAATSGRSLFIPAGTYNIVTPAYVTNRGVNIFGQGNGSYRTVLASATPGNTILFLNTNNVQLTDLTFLNNGVATSVSNSAIAGIPKWGTFRNININGFANGINLSQSWICSFYDTVIAGCTNGFISTNSTDANTTIKFFGGEISACQHSMIWSNTTDSYINCIVENGFGTGPQVSVDNCKSIRFVSTDFEAQAWDVSVTNSTHITFEGCSFAGTSKEVYTRSSRIEVANCYFYAAINPVDKDSASTVWWQSHDPTGNHSDFEFISSGASQFSLNGNTPSFSGNGSLTFGVPAISLQDFLASKDLTVLGNLNVSGNVNSGGTIQGGVITWTVTNTATPAIFWGKANDKFYIGGVSTWPNRAGTGWNFTNTASFPAVVQDSINGQSVLDFSPLCTMWSPPTINVKYPMEYLFVGRFQGGTGTSRLLSTRDASSLVYSIYNFPVFVTNRNFSVQYTNANEAFTSGGASVTTNGIYIIDLVVPTNNVAVYSNGVAMTTTTFFTIPANTDFSTNGFMLGDDNGGRYELAEMAIWSGYTLTDNERLTMVNTLKQQYGLTNVLTSIYGNFVGNGAGITNINSLGLSGATNDLASWPTAALAPGGFALVNSNATVYLLTSTPNSTTWAATNKIAP